MIPIILKILFTVVLLTTTLLSSTLPLTLKAYFQDSRNSNERTSKHIYVIAIGLLSCYGGGVFVGTCLMELIPDAHEKVVSGFTKLNLDIHNYPLPEFMICFGFILILISEQIGGWFEEERRKPAPPVHKPSILSRGKLTFSIRENAKESMEEQLRKTSNDPHLLAIRPAIGESHDCSSFHCPADIEMSLEMSTLESKQYNSVHVQPTGNQPSSYTYGQRKASDPVIYDHAAFQELAAPKQEKEVPETNGGDAIMGRKSRPVYGSVSSTDKNSISSSVEHQQPPPAQQEHNELHFDPDGASAFRAILLVGALSLHSLFEGMSLGLQDSVTSIASIFVAIIIHKSIIGFSIGLRLSRSNLSYLVVIICDAVFSFMSPIGSVAGILLSDQLSGGVGDLVNGMLTSIACGTFLYVTFFEIIPHELKESERKLLKMMVLVLGFATVAVLMFFTG